MSAGAEAAGEVGEQLEGEPVASSEIAADDPLVRLTVDAEWSEGDDAEPLDEDFVAAILEEIRAWKATGPQTPHA